MRRRDSMSRFISLSSTNRTLGIPYSPRPYTREATGFQSDWRTANFSRLLKRPSRLKSALHGHLWPGTLFAEAKMTDSMSTVKGLARTLNLLIVLALLHSSPLLTAGLADDIAVVVRADTPVDDMSLSDIRKLLLGDRQFWNGTLRVTLLIREPGARERDVVLKNIYRMNEAEFRRYWIEKIFRAEAQTGPKIAYSNDMATQLVAAIPGSIAFVDASRIPKNLKELKIDGRLPGEKGYALK